MKPAGIASCTAASIAATTELTKPVREKMNSKKLVVVVGLLLVSGMSSAANDSSTFTLYRNSVLDAKMRLHVASFDTADGAAYNQENCALAQQLFHAQPGVKTQFWCEPGRFRATALPHASPPAVSKQFTTGVANERTCSPSASELARPGADARSVRDYRCPK